MVSFNFTADVTYSNDSTILVGDQILGSIIYDPTQSGNNGLYTFTASSKNHFFTFKDYRNSVEIISDSYAGTAVSFYQITMSLVSGWTQMEIKGITIEGRTVTITFMADADLGITLPTSIEHFNIETADFQCD